MVEDSDASAPTAFPSEGARSGESPHSGEKSKKAHKKHKVLKTLYDVGESAAEKGERLELLKKISNRAKAHHPADDDVAEWMRSVRKRAEERAEQKWRKKFEDWQRAEGRAVRRGKGGAEVPSSAPELGGGPQEGLGDTGPDGLELSDLQVRQKLEAAEQRCEALRDANERLGRDLRGEQERSAELEQQLQQVSGERDAWRGRAARHGDRLQKAAAERRHAAAKVADLGRLLQDLSTRAPRDVELTPQPQLVESGIDPIPECLQEPQPGTAAESAVADGNFARQADGPAGSDVKQHVGAVLAQAELNGSLTSKLAELDLEEAS